MMRYVLLLPGLMIVLLLGGIATQPSSAQDIGDIIDIIGEETAELFGADSEITTERWDWATLLNSQTQISVDRTQISSDVDKVCIYVRREGGSLDDMLCQSVGAAFELVQISAINAPPLPESSGVAREGYQAYYVEIKFGVGPADVTGVTFIVQAPLDPDSPALVG